MGYVNTVITAKLVSRIALFAKLPEEERASLAARAAELTCARTNCSWPRARRRASTGYSRAASTSSRTSRAAKSGCLTYGTGDSFGELPLLLGSPVFANLRAAEPCRLLRLEGTDFLQLVSQCQVLSSEVTKTLVARVNRIGQYRVEHPAVAATVIGHSQDPACSELRPSSLGTGFRSPGSGRGMDPSRPPFSWPTALGWRNPTVRRLAEALGFQIQPEHQAYDVAMVGGGAAGLAAAVYGASEGLQTVLLERDVLGGEAGSSSRIENYLGFPNGLSGDELSDRARRQALRFRRRAAGDAHGPSAGAGRPQGGRRTHTLELDGEHSIEARTVILATGSTGAGSRCRGSIDYVGHGV